MDTTLYKVVFDGQTQPDQQPEQVRQNFTTLFRAQTSQIERLFSGQPIIVRKDLSQEEAEQYKEAIAHAGAVCHILSQQPPDGVPAPGPPDTLRKPSPEETEQEPFTIAALSPKGRLGRTRYIAYSAFALLLAAVVSAASWMLASGNDPVMGRGEYVVITLSAILLALLACVPLQMRRLHDLGHSGWLTLTSLTPLINIPFLLYVALQPGDRGRNRYGQPPERSPEPIRLLAIMFVVASGLILAAEFIERQPWL